MNKIFNQLSIRQVISPILDFVFPVDEKVRGLEHANKENIEKVLPVKIHMSDIATSLLPYSDETVKHLIWEIKYYRNAKAAEIVGVLLANRIKDDLKKEMGYKFFLVPIPMTRRRHNERGFDHTKLIAESILKNLPDNFSLLTGVLKKIRHTEPQSSLDSRLERLVNMENVFSVVDKEKIYRKNIIVIDDVTTTGATITDARRAVMVDGAKSVRAYAIAH